MGAFKGALKGGLKGSGTLSPPGVGVLARISWPTSSPTWGSTSSQPRRGYGTSCNPNST